MTENKRLTEIQKRLNFTSQEKFAKILGIKQGSLSDIYREKDGVGVSQAIKRILEKEYSINIEWLETGLGDMFTDIVFANNNRGKIYANRNRITRIDGNNNVLVARDNGGTIGGYGTKTKEDSEREEEECQICKEKDRLIKNLEEQLMIKDEIIKSLLGKIK